MHDVRSKQRMMNCVRRCCQLFMLCSFLDMALGADVLLCPGRKFNLYIECDTSAWMSVEEARVGYIPDTTECESTTTREKLMSTAPSGGCIRDWLQQLDRCQGIQMCTIDCKAGKQPLTSCSQSPESNVMYVKYSCYKNATVFVIVGSGITLLVILVFAFLTFKTGMGSLKKKKEHPRKVHKPPPPVVRENTAPINRDHIMETYQMLHVPTTSDGGATQAPSGGPSQRGAQAPGGAPRPGGAHGPGSTHGPGGTQGPRSGTKPGGVPGPAGAGGATSPRVQAAGGASPGRSRGGSKGQRVDNNTKGDSYA